MRNLLAGKTIRAVAHLDRGRVEHSTFELWTDALTAPTPDGQLYCAPHIPSAAGATRRVACADAITRR